MCQKRTDTYISRIPPCSLGEVLGSGQFGTVMKGEWSKDGGREKEEVAVKMLKKGSKASSTIKFLREAAIMGQFSHPNVVKLYGVCTEGEPVRTRLPESAEEPASIITAT